MESGKKYLLCLCGLFFLFQTGAQESFPFVSATNLENISYPFPEHYVSLEIQGEDLRMEYMDIMPDRPNGQTVVLLHGKNFSGAYWEQTAKDLSAAGFRVVIPDQIGFGKSSKPDRIQYSFQLLAQNIRAVLDTLNISQAVILGHSMGGMLATRFTLMFPERVSGLVLVNPIGLEDYKLYIPYQSVDGWYTGELNQTYQSMKEYQQSSYYGGQWKEEYEPWLDMTAGWTNNIDYPRIAWNSALLYDMIFTQPVCYEFAQIAVPVLLIIGQRDRTAIGKNKAPDQIKEQLGNYPVLGKETARLIPGSQLVELENIGHLPHIEAYDRFIPALLKFLEEKYK